MARFFYLMIGLLIGSIYALDVGHRVVAEIDRQWAGMISTYTLVGYHEGWQRGRDHTEGKWAYISSQCFEENDYLRGYIIHLKKGKK